MFTNTKFEQHECKVLLHTQLFFGGIPSILWILCSFLSSSVTWWGASLAEDTDCELWAALTGFLGVFNHVRYAMWHPYFPTLSWLCRYPRCQQLSWCHGPESLLKELRISYVWSLSLLCEEQNKISCKLFCEKGLKLVVRIDNMNDSDVHLNVLSS